MAPLRGTVIAAEEDVVVLDVDGRRMPVAYDQIAKATQVLPW
jgi:ribosome maturation factor RimP